METHGEESAFALHTCVACRKLALTDGETVANMESTVHVRVSHGAEVFGILLVQVAGRYGTEGQLLVEGSICVEDTILFPFLLVFLLDNDEGVAFLGLRKHQQIEWKAQPMAIWWVMTHAFQLLSRGLAREYPETLEDLRQWRAAHGQLRGAVGLPLTKLGDYLGYLRRR